MNETAQTIGPALVWLDLAGITIFALSGAVAAARRRLTLVTFIFFAVITGIGGGTVRDLLIGAPVFWIGSDAVLGICIAVALFVWMLPSRRLEGSALLWLDAVGLTGYASFGAIKGLAYGVAPMPAIAMGVITGCVGGILRDVMAGEPSIVVRPELYVTAAALAATLVVALRLLGVDPILAGTLAALAGFAMRAGAISRNWHIPAYRR